MEFAPLGGVVFDFVPLLDGHPAVAEGTAGVPAPGGVLEEFGGWRHRSGGLGHFAEPGIVAAGHGLNDVRMLVGQVGGFAGVGYDVEEPPRGFVAEFDDAPLFPAGDLGAVGIPEQDAVGVGLLFAEQQWHQVHALAMFWERCLGECGGGGVEVDGGGHARVGFSCGQGAGEGEDGGHAVVALPLEIRAVRASFAAAEGKGPGLRAGVAAVVAAENDQGLLCDVHFIEFVEDAADLDIERVQGCPQVLARGVFPLVPRVEVIEVFPGHLVEGCVDRERDVVEEEGLVGLAVAGNEVHGVVAFRFC